MDSGVTSPRVSFPRENTFAEIKPEESIYSGVLILPALSQKVQGHSWSREAVLALGLFFVTIAMQVGIGVIASHSIRTDIAESKKNLVHEDAHTSWTVDVARRIVPGEITSARGFMSTLLPGTTTSPNHNTSCCRGTACVGKSVCCSGASESELESKLWEPRPPMKPICNVINGTLDCLPQSFRLLDSWESLDTDKDGIWSADEARADAANVGCRVGTALPDMLQSACRGIMREASLSTANGGTSPAIPEDVKQLRAIPKPYFDLWRTLAMICINMEPSHCSKMVASGMFDSAMDPLNIGSIGGILDVASAVDYCQQILAPGGVCEAALPATYAIYRGRRREACGLPAYKPGPRYTNPHNPRDIFQTTTVSYSRHTALESTKSSMFLFGTVLVVLVWCIRGVDEMFELMRLWDFLMRFPLTMDVPVSVRLSTLFESIRTCFFRDGPHRSISEEQPLLTKDDFGTFDSDGSATEPMVIESFTWSHQYVCCCMAIARTVVLCFLCRAGIDFFVCQDDFMEILLNALALQFIFDLDEFVFHNLVPDETKQRMSRVQCLRHVSGLPTGRLFRFFTTKWFWGLVIIPLFAVTYVMKHNIEFDTVLLEALECACLQIGDRCQAYVADSGVSVDSTDGHWRRWVGFQG
eukprot:TRINITY_DN67053_c0_g1_i1.p1 TRINITY_DN67053_c0_g1~~TRINITY_DN67053_c0_g1_i1.p1  ORF type:complete len:641 (-),score=73.38 TRINITY_DN67053_c0_g1_i1:71-1993(-)